MNNTVNLRNGMLSMFSAVAFAFVALTSCESLDYNAIDENDKEHSSVNIITRSSSEAALEYPIHFYAFDKDGKLEGEQTVASASETLALSLQKGESYHVVAVCANDEVYNLPVSPTLSSVITLKTNGNANTQTSLGTGYSTDHPLQMGYANITPTASSTTLSIQMHYKVASLNVNLQNMPTECTSAKISVASPAGGVNMNGEYSNTSIATIPIKKSATEQGKWSTSTIYMFPTTGEQTVFTITYSDGTAEHSSAATYLGTLKSGTPYSITGTYDAGKVVVTDDVTPSTWGTLVNLAFTFGEGTNGTIDASGTESGGENQQGGGQDEQSQVITSAIPELYSVWNGHLVAAIYDANGNSLTETPASPASGTVYSLLLMSLKDWNNATPATAASLASAYSEGGMDSWSIPTKEEASALFNAYSMNSFRTSIGSAKADNIDASSSTVRYLCEDATKYFSFSYSSFKTYSSSDATYHLRLVKLVKIKSE